MTPERLHERLTRAPELAELVAGLDASVASTDPAPFFARAPAFASLLVSDFVRDLVRHELRALINDPARNIQDSFDNVWIVATAAGFELALVAAPEAGEAPSAVLHGSPRHRLIGAFWPDSLDVELYHHSRPHPTDVFDRSLALEPLGARTLRRGDVLPQRAWFDVLEPLPAPAPAFMLVFSSAPVDRLRWTYERATLKPQRPTPSTLAVNHLEYAIGTLLHLGHPDAAEVIAGLATHPSHHIRWTAIRAVAELDRDRGAALLAAAADDPHPHVRTAARRGLDQLGADRDS